MDIRTAKALNQLNASFYSQQAESFSSTRHSSWAGWSRALELAGISHMPNLTVDVACGNQRFEDFLLKRFPEQPLHACCTDNCQALSELSQASAKSSIEFHELDVVSALLEGTEIELPCCDLAVCFGFMHHIPTQAARKQLIDTMYSSLRPGGTLVVSFWQFMSVDSIARQAEALTRDASFEMDDNDYLLGWQNSPTARRYCHNFDIDQVRALAPSLDATFFEADGRNGRLNIYMVACKGGYNVPDR